MYLEPPPQLDLGEPARAARALALLDAVKDLNADYRPWRKVRYLAADRHLDPLDAWAALKILRGGQQQLPLLQASGAPFTWSSGNHLNEPLHRIDRALGGGGPASLVSQHGILADEAHRNRLRVRTLMDEAAESSIIEGAATTRKVAVEMLRSGRGPRTLGERMIFNNYVAMQQMKEWLSRPLSIDMLLDFQEVLTAGTLEDPGATRRFRRRDEAVHVVDERTNQTIFTPPLADALPERVQRVCDFANSPSVGQTFIHPVVKACILHFMIGYEHPFVDGNGRTARAVFYWFALREGYWPFEFMPISERIRAGFARYPQAYIDSELDGGDLTYFIHYKLDIIEQSLDAFSARLRSEEEKLRHSERLLKLSKNLNIRQRLLLEHGLRHPNTVYTRHSHATSNDVSLNTAATDLESLVKRRLMTRSKDRKEVVYHIAPGLAARLVRA